MSKPDSYGRYYWCIKTSADVSANKEIYLHGDSVETLPDGSLSVYSERGEDKFPLLIIAKGEWSAVYAASLFDGSAIAVEHWEGEINRVS